jgi:hypothetical protein
MSSTLKSKFALAAVIAVGAAAVPSAASAATPVPPLSAGDTQAYAALTAGGARITSPITRTFAGSLALNGTGGFRVTCANSSFTMTINVDGTTSVTGATFASCTTNVPGCNASAVASNLPWGNRLVRDSAGIFRDRINAQFTNTLSGTCPAPAGAYTYTGLLSPRVNGGTPATAVFDTNSGSVSSPLGAATVTGTLTGGAGQATYPRL